VFLIGIGALAALKVSIAGPEKQQAAFGDVAVEVSGNALAKTDKLDIEEIPDKKIIRSIAIVSAESAAPTPETKVANRQWHDGYAKAKPRKHHRRHISRKKYRRG
jgi:hypothetical protein